MNLETVDIDELVDGYDALLLDAYGVLVHSQGALPGAREFLARLEDSTTDYLVVTNDASRLPETCATRYRRDGLSIDADRILTSGLLIVPHLQERGIDDGPVCVLGTDDSGAYLTRAGYELVEPGDDRAQAVVLCDEAGYDFVPAIEKTLSMLVRAADKGRHVELVCPNPDRLYPSGPDSVGFTGGAVAALIEDALNARHFDDATQFARLGKPHSALFERALKRFGTMNVAMLGDQLSTDIKGANAVGIDSILVTGGLTRAEAIGERRDIQPTYLLSSLDGGS